MSTCRVFSCVVGRECLLLTSAFSWQNSVSLWPASFWTPRLNLPITPGISWLPTFAFQSPLLKRTFFGGCVSSRRSCRSSQNRSTSASSVLLVGAQREKHSQTQKNTTNAANHKHWRQFSSGPKLADTLILGVSTSKAVGNYFSVV